MKHLLICLMLILFLLMDFSTSRAADRNIYTGSVTGTVIAISSRTCVFSSIQFLNTTAAVAYLQVFNLPAASVTIGTTAPVASFGVAASGTQTIPFPRDGWFVGGSGCSVAGTTTRAGSTGASQDVNIVYEER